MVTSPPAVVMVTSASPKARLMGPRETSTWWILSMGTIVWVMNRTPFLRSAFSSSILYL